MNTHSPGNYFRIGDLNMYYEVHGAGEPLVLLHGGMTTIEASFGTVIPHFAPKRKIIAIEQQAHGHTADIDRPLSFPQMIEDTAALLRHLGISGADFFGYSDGGILSLGLAIKYPHLVGRLAIAGTNFNNAGLVPGLVEMFAEPKIEEMPEFLKDAYTRVAPRPEDWPQLVTKVMQQGYNFAGWSPEDLKQIQAPTLIIIGDQDIVRPEHAVELYRFVPNSHLAVLPNTDHGMRLPQADWLLSMLDDFLFSSPQ